MIRDLGKPSHRAKRQAKKVLINLPSRAEREAKGVMLNLQPRAQREAREVWLKLRPRAKRDATGSLVTKRPRAKREAKGSWSMYYLPTEGNAGERRKSDSRERQGFFASIVKSDKFLAIVKSYGNPITESDKFFMVLVMFKSNPNSIAESDKLVTQRPRAKRKAKG